MPLYRAAAMALASGLVVGISGCGTRDDAQVECRCTKETDVRAFPQCAEAVSTESSDVGNPFSSRLAECPSGSRLFLREPTTPEAVLFNVSDTMRGLSPVQYMDQLTEDFLFVPDAEALELYLDVYNPPTGYNPDATDADTLWNRDQERRFAVNVLDKTRFRDIKFKRWFQSSNDERIVGDDPLEERYIFPYAIEFTEQSVGEVAGEVFELRGRLEVDVITETDDNPVWLIRRMRDFRDFATARRSLTEIRGDFAQ